MSSQVITSDILANIAYHGKYYNPASNHYGSETTNVTCDKCRKNQLKTCIGWKEYDLCLPCADEITQTTSKPKPIMVTLMLQNQFKPKPPATLMMQNQFKPNQDDEVLTFMMQNQFKPTTRMEQTQYRGPRMVTKMMSSQYKSTNSSFNCLNPDTVSDESL